jgi:hypothetical protein
LVCADGNRVKLTGNHTLLLRELALCGIFANHGKLLSLFGDEDQSEKINKARIRVPHQCVAWPRLPAGFFDDRQE